MSLAVLRPSALPVQLGGKWRFPYQRGLALSSAQRQSLPLGNLASKLAGVNIGNAPLPPREPIIQLANRHNVMVRSLLLFGLVLALGSFALTWLQYQYLIRVFSTEIYIVLIAIGFAALGVWAGYRLTAKRRGPLFVRNKAALQSLGITRRETEVLDLLATGDTNKQIARRLGVSPNTVKSQLASLFAKLEASTRTEAIRKARELELVP
jgi:DNA-binding CsgD family transcriptional regulator